jgi:hypothetical protein
MNPYTILYGVLLLSFIIIVVAMVFAPYEP